MFWAPPSEKPSKYLSTPAHFSRLFTKANLPPMGTIPYLSVSNHHNRAP